MTTMTNDQLAALAKELVSEAAQKNIVLRVLGGVAVYLTCPNLETHAKLQRTYNDVDFVAAQKDFDALTALFTSRGVTLRTKEASRVVFDLKGVEIELLTPLFNDPHHIDFNKRLALSSPTLPLADLLLVKLQRKDFQEKDIQDAVALLVDHRVTRGESEDQIDREYIAKLGGKNWGLFTTVYDNTVLLEQILDKYLEPEEAQLAWRRIELIQEDMDREPKSFPWMVNQVFKRPLQVPR